MGGRDVEKDQLVGALLIIQARLFDRVARIAQVHKVDAFDDASILDIEAGDDPFG